MSTGRLSKLSKKRMERAELALRVSKSPFIWRTQPEYSRKLEAVVRKCNRYQGSQDTINRSTLTKFRLGPQSSTLRTLTTQLKWRSYKPRFPKRGERTTLAKPLRNLICTESILACWLVENQSLDHAGESVSPFSHTWVLCSSSTANSFSCIRTVRLTSSKGTSTMGTTARKDKRSWTWEITMWM